MGDVEACVDSFFFYFRPSYLLGLPPISFSVVQVVAAQEAVVAVVRVVAAAMGTVSSFKRSEMF